MADNPDFGREGFKTLSAADMTATEVDDWFAREVLPLESALIQFLYRNWRNASDIADIKQDIYVHLYESALKEIPTQTRQFVFITARNHLIDRARRAQIVSIEAMADLDALEIAEETPGPDRTVIARDELRQLQVALERLPERQRDVFRMAQIDGLSGREIALRMGLAENTVSQHLAKATRAIADILYGKPKDLRRGP